MKHVATEMRILRHKDDTEHAVHMEKRQWHAYDFITGRIYGHQYVTDAQLRDWIEECMEGAPGTSFATAFEQLVNYIYGGLTGRGAHQA